MDAQREQEEFAFESDALGSILTLGRLAMVRGKLTPHEISNLTDIWKGWQILSHSEQFTQFQTLLLTTFGSVVELKKDMEEHGVMLDAKELAQFFIFQGLIWFVNDNLQNDVVIIKSPTGKVGRITRLYRWSF